ncbi:3-oxo-tetronate kinase [Streptomyces sp. NBC_00316]|uniref:3-oxo-tetronate kinase n=1 Tax=Streptomyces sp. NBC_00316 TaxID=2975710 RepID=UPI002E2C0F83|nr:3-oxo-tetronate kinase [Streptomyces sp. NBC_00316]
MGIRLGCIADDFTGATDLANNLVRAGMRVVQLIDVPAADDERDVDADAVVIALKSRTVPAAEAVDASLRALDRLRSAGAEQIYFKYCSTFDSTPVGNIGPVTEALMDALGTDFTVATPAFPDNRRTVFQGHLFVGDVLLSESGMRDHPLTPMTDSNLVSVLGAQTGRPVGLIDHTVVADGAEAIGARIQDLREDGIAIADAVSNDDLVRLGAAVQGLPLVTAGSGLAIGLPANWGIKPSRAAAQLPPAGGHAAIVSGSVSVATNRQVQEFLRTGRPAFSVDPLRIAAGEDVSGQALAFAESHTTGRATRAWPIWWPTASPTALRAAHRSGPSCSTASDLSSGAPTRPPPSLSSKAASRCRTSGPREAGATRRGGARGQRWVWRTRVPWRVGCATTGCGGADGSPCRVGSGRRHVGWAG